MDVDQVISIQYRANFSKIFSTLLRILGTHNFSVAEDVTQETFQRALKDWRQKGLPENPSAWLMLAAKRVALDYLRQHDRRQDIITSQVAPSLTSEWTRGYSMDQAFSDENIQDDQLRLMFWLCSIDIADTYRLPLALKALCGLSVQAISRALLTKPETIKKRITRATAQLDGMLFEIPNDNEIDEALERVYQFLYLLFNEGISAHNPKPDSRNDICNAALVSVSYTHLTLPTTSRV